jgi:hypothetical protein
MSIPQFKDIEDVQKFLRHGGDEWCRPMVEEYMELIAFDVRPEEIDIEELNGWIENEVLTLEQGYVDWNNEHY